MSVPTCVEWWQLVGSGILVVPLLQLLKKLPVIGTFVGDWSAFLAMVLPGLMTAIAQSVTPYCERIDPLVWIALFAGGSYLIGQLTYWLSKDIVTPVGRALDL